MVRFALPTILTCCDSPEDPNAWLNASFFFFGVAATTTHRGGGVRVAGAGCAGTAPANGGGLHVHVALPASHRYGEMWVTCGTDDAVGISWQYFNSSTTQQQRRHSRSAGSKRRRSSDRSADHHRGFAAPAREAAGTAVVIQKTRQPETFQISAQSGPATGRALAASAINISSSGTNSISAHSSGPRASPADAPSARSSISQ